MCRIAAIIVSSPAIQANHFLPLHRILTPQQNSICHTRHCLITKIFFFPCQIDTKTLPVIRVKLFIVSFPVRASVQNILSACHHQSSSLSAFIFPYIPRNCLPVLHGTLSNSACLRSFFLVFNIIFIN